MNHERWERKWQRFDQKMDGMGKRMDRRMRHASSPYGELLAGGVFVIIGLAFLLDNMGYLDASRIVRFWPVILVAVGVFKLVEAGPNFAHSAGIFWIITGGLLLMGTLGLWRISLRDFWPLLFIGLGSLMLWRTVMTRRQFTQPPTAPGDIARETTAANASPPPSSDAIISATAVLGAVERRNNSQDFRGGSLTAILGGCDIDLRGASINTPNEAVLEVFAMMGGIEIRVPPDWAVISQVAPVLGGYEDTTQPPKETTKRLIVRGNAVMGGIEVTN